MAMDEANHRDTDAEGAARTRQADKTLDDAFIGLMPEAKRAPSSPSWCPAVSRRQTPAIEAEGLTRRFGDSVASITSISASAGRDLRLPRLERLRQNDNDEDADSASCRRSEGRDKLFGKPRDRATWRHRRTSAT